ncbi:Zinc knuckle [Popillia japonica]|uniref:Zinc knuckle n=1 Tax=Popillia japonica TaxID=7064 RepID=A0AAW1JGE0_POPJA
MNYHYIIGFADADRAESQKDRKSTTGFLYQVFGGTVCWSTSKQSTVAISSAEAEYVALTETAREGVWLPNLLTDFGYTKTKFPNICILPRFYDPLVTALETLEPDKLTLDFVKGKLLDQQMKERHQRETNLSNPSAAFSSSNQNRRTISEMRTTIAECRNCGKPGHKRSECRIRKQANQANHEDHEDIVAFPVFKGSSFQEVFHSTGATDYMLKRLLRYTKGALDYELYFDEQNELPLTGFAKGALDYELYFDEQNELPLTGFASGDWAESQKDRKSSTGYRYQVFGGTVCWSTSKQSTVAISSTEAEYVALKEAAREGVWLANLLTDFGYAKIKFPIYEDNQSCIKLTKNGNTKE